MLLSPGIGHRSLRRGLWFGTIFFLFTTAISLSSNLVADDDVQAGSGDKDGDEDGDEDKDRDEEARKNEGKDWDDDGAGPFGVALLSVFHYGMAVVYLALWLAPDRCMSYFRVPLRRPGAKVVV